MRAVRRGLVRVWLLVEAGTADQASESRFGLDICSYWKLEVLEGQVVQYADLQMRWSGQLTRQSDTTTQTKHASRWFLSTFLLLLDILHSIRLDSK